MNVAFYSPIKPPDHPVPSGDRTMANQLMAALRLAGHEVTLASRLRSYSSSPHGQDIHVEAQTEIDRLIACAGSSKPDLWFTYHPYYKAPDLVGPTVARALAVPYVTAEASYSSRRQAGDWAASQSHVVDAARQAVVNFCITPIDRDGLSRIVDQKQLADLPGFIDTSRINIARSIEGASGPCRLITVAMMRQGVKFESYALLAAALKLVGANDWSLTVIGDGSARPEVEQLFAELPADRVTWCGELGEAGIAQQLSVSDVFVWPGFGEAYGLAYLEAQASGLPVIAHDTHGVPSVVRHGETGLLTPPGDISAYAEAIDRLATDHQLRQMMSQAAARFVHDERNLETAARILNEEICNRMLS